MRVTREAQKGEAIERMKILQLHPIGIRTHRDQRICRRSPEGLLIFARITALLVKGADKAMTIKDGIKFGIGFIIGRNIANNIGNLLANADVKLMRYFGNKWGEDWISGWNKVAPLIDESLEIKPEETKKPIKNVIGFSVN